MAVPAGKGAMSAREIVIKMGKITVAAIKNNGEPNARGER